MFESFTQRARKVLALAKKEVVRLNHEYVDTEHILLGLAGDGEGIAAIALQNIGVDMESIRIETEEIITYGNAGMTLGEVPFTPSAKRVVELSAQQARELGHNYIGTEHLLLGLIKEKNGIAAKVLENLGATHDNVKKEVLILLGMPDSEGAPGKTPKKKFQALEEFGRDLTKLAKEDKLDPMIGREKEIERVIQILSRRTKNNPVLIGEPGVGKTAISEGLAQRIVMKEVPVILQKKRIIALDLASVVAGTKFRGQFEERLKIIMKEVKSAKGDIVLFIDEIHTLIGAGAAEGAIDASNMLKPALSRGELQCIGATTLDEFRKHIEKDGALERRFQQVMIEPSNIEETMKIIKGLKPKYEQHHSVRITDSAIKASVELSDRYVADRFLPDKAIDLIDEACSRARLNANSQPTDIPEMEKQLENINKDKKESVISQDFEKAARLRDQEREVKLKITDLKKDWNKDKSIQPSISAEDIAYVVSRWTGISVTRIEEKETSRLLGMEDEIHDDFVGQDDAVKSICKAIRRSKAKLKDPKRPIGSFIFLGPTGVGKTYLARILAKYLFGDENALVTFDMSEYQEKFNISRLIGSPPGYVGYEEGGLLTEKIRRRPYALILLDEIEKAHPDVFNIFLQILENGRLTDSLGHEVDFRNTVVIMTSNIGARNIEKNTSLGFVSSKDTEHYDKMKEKVIDELKKTFRPEFLNRIDEVIVFRSLDNEELKKIIDIMMTDIQQRLGEKSKIILSEKAKEFLIEKRDNPSYGARPLKRTIQKYIEDPLSESILKGHLHDSCCIKVDLGNDDDLSFSMKDTLELAAAKSDKDR